MSNGAKKFLLSFNNFTLQEIQISIINYLKLLFVSDSKAKLIVSGYLYDLGKSLHFYVHFRL